MLMTKDLSSAYNTLLIPISTSTSSHTTCDENADDSFYQADRISITTPVQILTTYLSSYFPATQFIVLPSST